MESATKATVREVRQPSASYARDWGRTGAAAGYLAGGALFATTLLFVAEQAGLLADSPTLRRTGAGPAHDIAVYYAALFHYQHQVLWDISLRDCLGPLGFLAVMVVALTVRQAVGPQRPLGHLTALFLQVGALLLILDGVIYLAGTDYWRLSGWTADPPANMIAAGRGLEIVDSVTNFLSMAGYVVLALGLVCLGRLCRTATALPRRLAPFAWAEAAALAGAVVASQLSWGTVFDVLILLVGAVLGPVVMVWLGHHFKYGVPTVPDPPA
jgi:hypothetical protein